MATALKNLSSYEPDNIPSAKGLSFGLVVSEYNPDVTLKLRDGAIQTILENGGADEDIHILYVPGAFELPSGAQLIELSEGVDAVICLGCVIKGDTDHDKYINHAVAQGLTNLSLELKKPVIFGLLTTNNQQQAVDRSGGKHGNKGVECAVAAIKMADAYRQLL